MIEREVVKQTAELLKGIIRSIDKKLEYSLVDQTQEGSSLFGCHHAGGKELFHTHRGLATRRVG